MPDLLEIHSLAFSLTDAGFSSTVLGHPLVSTHHDRSRLQHYPIQQCTQRTDDQLGLWSVSQTKGQGQSAARAATKPSCWRTEADFRFLQCSGDRPACIKCLSKQESCEYDIEEGSTRLHDLRARLSDACEELALLKNFVASLKFSSDADAALLLARLRLGDSIVQVASSRLPRLSKCVRLIQTYCSRI